MASKLTEREKAFIDRLSKLGHLAYNGYGLAETLDLGFSDEDTSLLAGWGALLGKHPLSRDSVDEETSKVVTQYLLKGDEESYQALRRMFKKTFQEWIDLEKQRRQSQTTASKVRDMRGYVYVLKSRKLYKIGMTKNFELRINTYRTENPFGVDIIATYPVRDRVAAERTLLQLFAHRKVIGEWHRLTKAELAQIPLALKNFLLSEPGLED